MLERTGAQVLVDCLLAQGVTTAFGVPGESYLAVLDALYDVADRIRMVPNRQEGGAAFMAAAWGKLTGTPGVCFVTRGPGATNAAIGVHSARQDSSPMVLFVGQIETRMREREAFQEVDYRAAFGAARQVGDRDRERRPRRRDRRPRLRRRAAAAGRGRSSSRFPRTCCRRRRRSRPGRRCVVPVASPAPADVDRAMALLAAAERPLVSWSGTSAGPRPRAPGCAPSPRRTGSRSSATSAARTSSTTRARPMPATPGSARRRTCGRCSRRRT